MSPVFASWTIFVKIKKVRSEAGFGPHRARITFVRRQIVMWTPISTGRCYFSIARSFFQQWVAGKKRSRDEDAPSHLRTTVGHVQEAPCLALLSPNITTAHFLCAHFNIILISSFYSSCWPFFPRGFPQKFSTYFLLTLFDLLGLRIATVYLIKLLLVVWSPFPSFLDFNVSFNPYYYQVGRAAVSRPALAPPPQPPIKWVSGALSQEVKLPGHEAGHSPPSSAVVNSEWSYTSTSTYVFMLWCLVKYRVWLHCVIVKSRGRLHRRIGLLFLYLPPPPDQGGYDGLDM
jgi:hypothetical protein